MLILASEVADLVAILPPLLDYGDAGHDLDTCDLADSAESSERWVAFLIDGSKTQPYHICFSLKAVVPHELGRFELLLPLRNFRMLRVLQCLEEPYDFSNFAVDMTTLWFPCTLLDFLFLVVVWNSSFLSSALPGVDATSVSS